MAEAKRPAARKTTKRASGRARAPKRAKRAKKVEQVAEVELVALQPPVVFERDPTAERDEPLSAYEKVMRDDRMVIDRFKGASWATLSWKYGLCDRHCREIMRDWRARPKDLPGGEDPVEYVHETINRMHALQDEALMIALDSRTDRPTALASIRARANLIEQEFIIRHAAGMTPTRAEMRVMDDQRWMIEKLFELLEKHAIPEKVQDEFHEAILVRARRVEPEQLTAGEPDAEAA